MSELLPRIPPHNLDAERAVLGLVLVMDAPPGVIATIAEKLIADDFYLDAHRTVYSSILDLAAAGRDVNLITLADELRRRDLLQPIGGAAALGLLVEHASIPAHLQSYIDLVRQKAVLRELIMQATDAITDAFEDKADGQLVIDRTRERLEQLASRATAGQSRFVVRRFDELRRLALRQPEFLIEDWLPADLISFIVGDSEAFKSWLTKYMGICIASGTPFFGRWPVRQAPVLFVSEENGLVEDKRRADLIYDGMRLERDDFPFYIASDTSFSFDDPATYTALRSFVKEHGIRCVIMDSFVRVHRRKEQDAGEMSALYQDRMKPMLRDGVALVALHHKRKLPAGAQGQAAAAGGGDEIRGSGDIRAMTSAVVVLRRVGPKEEKKVVLAHDKTRGFDAQPAFVFRLAGSSKEGRAEFVYEGKPEAVLDKSEACRLAVLQFAAERNSFRREELVQHFAALKKAGQPTYSKKVFDPVLKKLSTDDYPLKKDKLGRDTFFHFVSDDVDEVAEPGANDAPF